MSSLFERAPHLRVVEPPKSESRIARTASVDVMREGNHYWVRLTTVAGGDAWSKVSRATLLAFLEEAQSALRAPR